ncbi:unnamed protein product [Leuciscus chuanchicus]
MDVFAKDRKALVVCGTPGQDVSKTKGNNSEALWLFEQTINGGGSLETNERSEEHTWEGRELPSPYLFTHILSFSVPHSIDLKTLLFTQPAVYSRSEGHINGGPSEQLLPKAKQIHPH